MIADKIHSSVYSLFTYVTDEEQHGIREQWDMHVAEVDAGEKFSGDCEDFAITCVELLLRTEEKRDVALVYCLTSDGGGHMICVYKRMWALDCNYPFVYRMSREYTWKYIMTLDKPGEWYAFNAKKD